MSNCVEAIVIATGERVTVRQYGFTFIDAKGREFHGTKLQILRVLE